MIRIITDSASDMDITWAQKHHISVLPMQIQCGEHTYQDRYELDADAFYNMLTQSATLPSTSQITPYTFEEEFLKVHAAGDEALVIVMSGALSGTYASACLAAAAYDEIHVVDSCNVTVGEHCLLSLAIRLRAEGKSVIQIKEILEDRKQHIRVLALLDTLEYLKKGGRIPATTALAGTLLSIKPVVSVKDGAVEVIGKARGSKNGNNLLVELVKKSSGIDFTLPLYLGYTGCNRALLDQYIADSHLLWESHITADALQILQIGSTIGTHVGPGAIAIAFFSADN